MNQLPQGFLRKLPQLPQDTLDLLRKYNREKQFQAAIQAKDYTMLYQMALHYGLLDVFSYLYQTMKIPFDAKMLTQYYHPTQSGPPPETTFQIETPIETGLSNQIGITIQVNDKFSPNRAKILQYFDRMKRYSRYSPGQGKFMYQYNIE